MKYIFLALALLIPSFSLHAISLSLTKEAKDYILTSTCAGSIMGMMVGGVARDLTSSCGNPHQTVLVAGIAGGAVAGALLGYLFNPDMRFKRNINKHWTDACQRWQEFKNDEILNTLCWLNERQVLDVEYWYSVHLRDSLYDAYPLVSAHNFLTRKYYALKELAALFEKIADSNGENEETPLRLNNQNQDHLYDYLFGLDKAINCFENSEEYQRQYALYYASLPKYYPQPAPKTMVYQPIFTYPSTATVATAPAQRSVAPTISVQPAVQPAPASTLSPVLKGDVYGTIWSNY